MSPRQIHLIAAARPNFMKIAPLYRALQSEDWCNVKLVHTGQHYDPNMSAAFFRDFGLPEPDIHLGVGSGSHAEQTGNVMIAYERVCSECPPDWIVVVGDVNSTIACALVGAKMHIAVAHLEAGLRSRDRSMPEEINRIATDAIADLLWTPSPDADENLLAEGVPAARIERVGNIMIDAFELMRDTIAADGTASSLGLKAQNYAVVTLHRPSNVDDKATLGILVEQLTSVAASVPLVFAVHPRTLARLKSFNLYAELRAAPNVTLIDPLGYVQFMNLVVSAGLVITDSGGVQEETTYLNIPCLTLRNNTERPITITAGSNQLIKPAQLLDRVRTTRQAARTRNEPPPLWDGHTARRVAASLKRRVVA